MQLPNEQGVSKGGMQSHFGMRIRHDIAEIYSPCALYNRCFYIYAQTNRLSITVKATIKQRAWRIYFDNIMSDAHPKVGLHSPFGNPLLVWQLHPARVTWRLLIKSGHCRALTNFCGKSAKVPSNAGSFAQLRSASRNFSARFAGIYPANCPLMRSRPTPALCGVPPHDLLAGFMVLQN